RDLDVLAPAGIPQRLEQPIAESKREQVLHRLLAEIVVDAEGPLLRKGGGYRVVDGAKRGEVGAQRLLQADPRLLPGQSCGSKPGDGRLKQRRCGREQDGKRLGS